MPVSVVVGGQFGSEGKGKVALELARLRSAVAAVRVGGPNSGHTAIDVTGKTHVFRHLPTAALLPDVTCVIGAGSYVDPEVLLGEIARTNLPPRVF
jgi:adenylosuccinate synthase